MEIKELIERLNNRIKKIEEFGFVTLTDKGELTEIKGILEQQAKRIELEGQLKATHELADIVSPPDDLVEKLLLLVYRCVREKNTRQCMMR